MIIMSLYYSVSVEAMFHTLPLDKEGHVSSADLGEAIAAKKGEATSAGRLRNRFHSIFIRFS